MNASCGIETLPTVRMCFFPSLYFSSSLRLQVISPPMIPGSGGKNHDGGPQTDRSMGNGFESSPDEKRCRYRSSLDGLRHGMHKARTMIQRASRVETNPEVMDGLPVLTGTRIPVYVILEMIEEGKTLEDIAGEFPHPTVDQIRAGVAHARDLVSR